MCDWLVNLPEKERSFFQDRIKRAQGSGAPLLMAQFSLQPLDAAAKLGSPRSCPLLLVEGSIVRTPDTSGRKDLSVFSRATETFDSFLTTNS